MARSDEEIIDAITRLKNVVISMGNSPWDEDRRMVKIVIEALEWALSVDASQHPAEGWEELDAPTKI